MKHLVTLANGVKVPALGQGTWYLGDSLATRDREINAIRTGVEQGMTLIDTAEMYGSGRSERLVGEAIKPFDRDKLFLVSKVLPSNAGGKKLERALDASMQRMGVDHLDLYLYHWRGGYSLEETVACLEDVKKKGKIRAWGVSNFDIDDMEELWRVPNGKKCQVNQVLYHMGSRGIEYSLLPWMQEHNVALMAYCPLAQGGRLCRKLLDNDAIMDIAAKYNAEASQIALAWAIRSGHTIAIPRTGRKEHTLLNAGADAIELTAEDFEIIDQQFKKPRRKQPLDIQ